MKLIVAGAVFFAALLFLVFLDRDPPLIDMQPSGSFTLNGEYPSLYTSLVHGLRYASWSGSDKNQGSLRSAPFAAPAALTMAVAGYPSHPQERIELRQIKSGALLRLLTPATSSTTDPGTSWQYVLVDVPQKWRGSQIELLATDNGGAWGDWLGIASLRAARLDERLLHTPVLSRWSYIGFVYFGLMLAALGILLHPFPRIRSDPVYPCACMGVTLIAFFTGWTNADLSGWFATWGRDALHFGPASLYEGPWASDNPPLNPTVMVIPAFLEALFRTSDAHLDPFLFKLIPVGSLIILPLLIRSALVAVGIAIDRGRFRVLVICTVVNPVFIYATAIWGQSDIVVCGLILASFIGFVTGRPILGAALYVAGILTKPQPILALPVMLVIAFTTSRPLKVVAGVCLVLFAVLPSTYPHGGFLGGYGWLIQKFAAATNEYPWATVGAGTLPGLLTGDGLNDDGVTRFGLSVHTISMVSVAVAFAVLCYTTWRERVRLTTPIGLWYLATSCMVVYWLAPHMHERYIIYAVVLTIAWAFGRSSRLSIAAAACLCVALFLQMIANWPIDLGWPHNTMDTALLIAPHSVYFTVYAALDIAGLVLLLVSRADIPANLPLRSAGAFS